MTATMDILAVSLFLPGWWDWVISAGLFGTVVAGVVFIFSQPGEISVSHQRQAALATGHSDRTTLFENTAIRPVLRLLLTMAHRLNMPRLKGWLRKQIVAAGSPNYYTAEEYLALSMLMGLAIGVFLEIISLVTSGSFSILSIILGLVIGISLAVFNIADQANKRLLFITRQLPYALDLISLAMGAGATFIEAARSVITEDQDNPLNVELRAVLAEMELGTTRRQALQNLATRVPIESIQNLVASVIQAEELGTPLGDVLHDQATLLRMRRTVRAEHNAAVASVRVLLPTMLLAIAVILIIFGPAIVRIAQNGLF